MSSSDASTSKETVRAEEARRFGSEIGIDAAQAHGSGGWLLTYTTSAASLIP
jgi:hypothetical protein